MHIYIYIYTAIDISQYNIVLLHHGWSKMTMPITKYHIYIYMYRERYKLLLVVIAVV